HHRHLYDCHYLATLDTQDGATQDLLCIGIDDGLHEAARLAGLQGTDHEIHRQFRHTDVAPLFSGLVFAHANPSKLGIDKDGVGDKAILSAGVAMLKQVGAQNAEVIVRDVGESWPTFHITQRVYARNVGFQLPIDLDETLLVQVYASSFGC